MPRIFSLKIFLRLFHIFVGLTLASGISAQVYFLNGTAINTSEDCYTLTWDIANQNGSVWYADQVDLNQPLDLQFVLNLGSSDSGADGICFVMQTVGTDALGATGGGLGFSGVDFQPSFGVEFDTYHNGQNGDLLADHIGFISNGSVDHNAATAIAGPVQADLFDANIEDGQDHTGRFLWDPITQLVQVYFDCEFRLEASVDLIDGIFDGQNLVYFGFTASTGGENNIQTVCLEEDILGSAAEQLICPGGELQLSVSGGDPSGTFLWEPPAYLDDPSSATPVTTPSEDITYTASYTDDCGVTSVDTVHVSVEIMTAAVSGVGVLTCDQDALQIQAISNFPAPLNFDWTVIQGAFESTNGALATIETPGNYEVLVSSQNGACTAAASFEIIQDTASFSGLVEDLLLSCDEPTPPLQVTDIDNPSAVVVWNAASGGEVTLVDGQPTASSGGTYTATITNPLNGCTRQLELTAIDLQGDPQINAGMVNALTCLASQQEVQGAGVTPFTPAGWGAALTPVIAWHNIATPGGIAPPTGGFNPVVAQAGTYVLTVTWLESGCSSTDTLTAVEGDDFGLDIASMAFPNVITPNGDQRNDAFRPYLRDLPDLEGLSVLDNYYLRVFDRWGVQVYNNTDGIAGGLPIRWPGTNNAGDLLAAGTYWFVVDYRSSCGDRQEGHRQGWLSILVD